MLKLAVRFFIKLVYYTISKERSQVEASATLCVYSLGTRRINIDANAWPVCLSPNKLEVLSQLPLIETKYLLRNFDNEKCFKVPKESPITPTAS